jgi:hypothetical protein
VSEWGPRSSFSGGKPRLVVPADAPPVTRIRTTLISASLLTLKEKGKLDAYLRELPREYHDIVLGVVAGDWAPIAVGIAHYSALDRLAIPVAEQFQNGHDVGARLHKGVLGTAARLVGSAGATPWTALEQMPRLWQRMLEGGGVGLYELGPKDARIEFVRCPLVRYAYCRNGFRGMIASAMEPFCRKIFVNDIRELSDDNNVSMHAAWA